MFFRFAQFLVAPFFKIFYPTKVLGKKNLPKGACIISSNHTSNFDAILFAINTWEKKYYLAKKELFKNKLVGACAKGIGCVKIDRESADVNAIKNSLKLLKKGKKLVIFPEGTRAKSEDLELGQIKQGVSMFAIKAKVPVVPMYIARKPKAFHKTIIAIGEPFSLEQYYGKRLDNEVLSAATAMVEEKMQALRENTINSLTKKK